MTVRRAGKGGSASLVWPFPILEVSVPVTKLLVNGNLDVVDERTGDRICVAPRAAALITFLLQYQRDLEQDTLQLRVDAKGSSMVVQFPKTFTLELAG